MRSGVCWKRTTHAGSASGSAGQCRCEPQVRRRISPHEGLTASTSCSWKAYCQWPTPNVPNGGRTTWHAEQKGNSFYHNGQKVQLGLEQAVRLWATPSASDWRSGKASQETLERNSRPLNEQVTAQTGGQLNPTWVEWLMEVAARVERLRALGNGEVPTVAATAWQI